MDSRKPSTRTSLRLHHFLALCGLGSRRACERLIESRRVTVDQVVIRRQGVGIDPAIQQVAVDGQPVCLERKVYLVINKPRDVVCTASDPQGRRTFKSLLPGSLGERVFTVGRLDQASEGLLVVTNDGDLAHVLMHPRHNVEKVYLVWPRRPLTPEEEQHLRRGVRSEGERLGLDELSRDKDVYRIRLREGRNRHIRRMFAVVGVGIVRLKRLAVGPIQLGSLRSGGWRYLEEREIQALWNYIRCREKVGETRLRIQKPGVGIQNLDVD
ncbi:MAG: rRNA pseudouridine synthase [Verrucomicrobia bacterium]|nr:rRNA pseudouridine synthase [Verrucomicrobiota bacterium]MBU4430117.1 rRNA pseudouridine synthase [Verrucomicrobiota bacterium]MCG2680354.1 rRNA pseudouridine synthase [Kiritimatiellia bacterium]